MINLCSLHTICGTRGSGKSYYIKKFIIPAILRSGKRCIVWDYKGEYERNKGYEVIVPKDLEVCPDYLESLMGRWLEEENLVIIIEEAGMLIPKMSPQRLSKEYPNIFRMLHCGRSNRIGCFMITQMPQQLLGYAFRLCETVTMFKLFSGTDKNFIADCLPDNARGIDARGKLITWYKVIDNLKKHWFIFFNIYGEVKLCPPIKTKVIKNV